jgi:DNA-binding GntR family transcriptional regulator
MQDEAVRQQPVERRIFRDEIREHLIEDILSGRLPPGTRIVETRLAHQFGVSQAPVREALRDLALYGFVVSSPFRATEVRRITPEELLEIYPIRAAIEGVAARAAATRMDDASLDELERLIDTMRDAAARNDQRAQASADGEFHQAIIKAAGNRMLEHVWQTMRLSVTTCVTHSVTHRSLHEIAERHVPVLEALRAHDPARAEAAIRRHIEEPGEWIRESQKPNEPRREVSAAGVRSPKARVAKASVARQTPVDRAVLAPRTPVTSPASRRTPPARAARAKRT